MSEENTQPTTAAEVLGSETQNSEQAQNNEQTVEAKPEAPQQEAKQEDHKIAAKFAALSRKEKQLRQREREIEQKIRELEQKVSNSQPKEEPVKEEIPLDLKLKKDPFNTLKELGFDYETLAEIAKNEGKLTPAMQMKLMQEELERKFEQKVRMLEEKLRAKEQEESQTKEQQIVENFKRQIEAAITSDAEKYEFLNLQGDEAVGLVYDVIETHYDETGSVLDINEALQLVEDHFEAEAKRHLEKSRKIKKLIETSSQSQKPQATGAKKPSVTLTNEQAQTASKSAGLLSDDESKKEAAKLIRWLE